jgi:hypothetical protein
VGEFTNEEVGVAGTSPTGFTRVPPVWLRSHADSCGRKGARHFNCVYDETDSCAVGRKKANRVLDYLRASRDLHTYRTLSNAGARLDRTRALRHTQPTVTCCCAAVLVLGTSRSTWLMIRISLVPAQHSF